MKSASSRKSKRAPRSAARRSDEAVYSSVASLAEITADSVDALMRKIDDEVFRELKAIGQHIQTLRREISVLKPGEMHRKSIPAAGHELDEVVHATESASNRILECAEEVMAANSNDVERYKAFVQQRMLSVFEACSFQDLTGQRIAKVIDTLKQIETRVARFAVAARADENATPSPEAGKPGGNSQSAVDKIFAAPRRK
jgi:chemotaxis protein CheZ